MKIVNNLFFRGNCREAFETYAKILGGEIKAMQRFGDTEQEAHLGPDFAEMTMHAWLEVGDQALMGCDAPPKLQRESGGFTVAIHTDDVNEARRIFEALAEGGVQTMPFEGTFWSPGMGMVIDRFGVPWVVNTNAARAPQADPARAVG